MLKNFLAIGCGATFILGAAGSVWAGDPEAGKAKYATCAACHGANGVSATPANPTLAGRDLAYIKEALTAYKSGARANPTMKAMAAGLSDTDIDNLAAYIASFPKP